MSYPSSNLNPSVFTSKRRGSVQAEEGPVSQAKRPKGWNHVVDQLPVRSRLSPVLGSSSPSSGETMKSYFSSTSPSMRADDSPKTSLKNSFALDSGTDRESNSSRDAADTYPTSKEQYQASAERFAKYHTDPARHTESLITPRGLKWPKTPVPGLNEAPLAVIWEVTRFIQHAGVDAAEYALSYHSSGRWHDQSALRAMHASHGPFVGKSLPPASEAQAWDLALNGFQSDLTKGIGNKVVTLSAELVPRSRDTGPLFEFRLNPLKLDPLGHRLSRRFGADRFLEIIMPSPFSLQDGLSSSEQHKNCALDFIQWLTGSIHHFLGRTWSAFYCRDFKKTSQSTNAKSSYLQRVFLFATDGDSFRVPDQPGVIPPPQEALTPESRTKMELHELLDWAIDLKRNSKMSLPKLFNRISLSLTRTWPTVVLERHQIRIREKDIGTHEVMNDGIGRMSRSLAKKVASYLPVTDTPSCYQARIGSAKGMWIINCEDDGLEDHDWIEIYPSQSKWECDYEDAAHRVMEVKRWPRELRPAHLNQQFIPLLEQQAKHPPAMRRALKEHLEKSLVTEIDSHMTALGHPTEYRLWLRRTGGSRPGNALHGHVPFLAGLPRTDEESIAYLLDAGFDAKRLKYIQDLSRNLSKERADQLRTKSRVLIPKSTYALMVADFASVLEEGEISCSFSSKFQVDGFCDTLLEGLDALVARAPAHSPSDIQKVKVVSHPSLRRLKDVIVFSTKGRKPLASMLSGGDYDGDEALLIFDEKLTANFRNAPVDQGPDLFDRGYLRRLNLTVEELGPGRVQDHELCARFLYLAFLFHMRPSLLGQVTKYKERMCYKRNSVSDDAVITLSTLAGHLVDQGKQGTLFEMDDWDKLRRELIGEPSRLDDPHYFSDKLPDHGRIHGGNHILDYLKFKVAGKTIHLALTAFEELIQSYKGNPFDSDLTKLYNRYEEKSKTSESLKLLLKSLRADISAVSEIWSQRRSLGKVGKSDYTTTVKEVWAMWLNIRPSNKAGSSDMMDWDEDSALGLWNLLKASATFKYHHKKETFTWRMAGTQLCLLKLKETNNLDGTAAAFVHPRMWVSLKPDKGYIARARDERIGAAMDEMMDYDDD